MHGRQVKEQSGRRKREHVCGISAGRFRGVSASSGLHCHAIDAMFAKKEDVRCILRAASKLRLTKANVLEEGKK